MNSFSKQLFYSSFCSSFMTQRWYTISSATGNAAFLGLSLNRNFSLLQNSSCDKEGTILQVFWFCRCNAFPEFSILEQASVVLNSLWLRVSFMVITLKRLYSNCHSVSSVRNHQALKEFTRESYHDCKMWKKKAICAYKRENSDLPRPTATTEDTNREKSALSQWDHSR